MSAFESKAGIKSHYRHVRSRPVASFRGHISASGIDPIGSMPEEFGTFLRKEIPRWKQIVQDGGVKVEGER
jgi:hypothetical protein